MLKSNSKQSWGIHVVSPEEEKEATVALSFHSGKIYVHIMQKNFSSASLYLDPAGDRTSVSTHELTSHLDMLNCLTPGAWGAKTITVTVYINSNGTMFIPCSSWTGIIRDNCPLAV